MPKLKISSGLRGPFSNNWKHTSKHKSPPFAEHCALTQHANTPNNLPSQTHASRVHTRARTSTLMHPHTQAMVARHTVTVCSWQTLLLVLCFYMFHRVHSSVVKAAAFCVLVNMLRGLRRILLLKSRLALHAVPRPNPLANPNMQYCQVACILELWLLKIGERGARKHRHIQTLTILWCSLGSCLRWAQTPQSLPEHMSSGSKPDFTTGGAINQPLDTGNNHSLQTSTKHTLMTSVSPRESMMTV